MEQEPHPIPVAAAAVAVTRTRMLTRMRIRKKRTKMSFSAQTVTVIATMTALATILTVFLVLTTTTTMAAMATALTMTTKMTGTIMTATHPMRSKTQLLYPLALGRPLLSRLSRGSTATRRGPTWAASRCAHWEVHQPTFSRSGLAPLTASECTCAISPLRMLGLATTALRSRSVSVVTSAAAVKRRTAELGSVSVSSSFEPRRSCPGPSVPSASET
mmetsp:Transcript_38347/g.114812  ORF Transcript_38347/g.114812 Transcript_38347/m.114812 type:complete len:217 (-) Transcript_38347:1606-2256(-)